MWGWEVRLIIHHSTVQTNIDSPSKTTLKVRLNKHWVSVQIYILAIKRQINDRFASASRRGRRQGLVQHGRQQSQRMRRVGIGREGRAGHAGDALARRLVATSIGFQSSRRGSQT